MKNLLACRLCTSLYCLFLLAGLSAFGQTGLVISQLYGGGGNSGSPYTYDYLELYNPTASPISIAGYSVQYAAAAGTSWNAVALPSVTVAAGHYFLIQGAAGNASPANLPVTPDFKMIDAPGATSTSIPNFSATTGKIALVNSTVALSGACPITPTNPTVIDFIGYGTTTCFEGATVAPAPSNTTVDIRTNPANDSNNNGADFTIGSPNPHNSGNGTPTVITAAIHTIQGSKSATALRISPLAGQQVATSGVVTAVLPSGFFIQARDSDADSDLTTPEGIEVFTGSGKVPATAVVGNLVQVTGTVATFPAVNASHTPATEITSPTVTLTSSGNPLPTPVAISSSMLTPGGGLYQLTPYEGMRVSIASITAVSGTTGSITSANEATETATSNGYFYGVITGTPRPFREPGIDIRDTAIPGAPANVVSFDDNPERILVDSVIGGGTSIELSTGSVLTNVTGVLDFTFSSDSFYDPSRLILDPTYNRANFTPGMAVTPIPPPAAAEFTVASYNVERFYNPVQALPDNLYFVPAGVNGFNGSSGGGVLSNGQTFISSAVDVTPAAYQRRLQKVSLAVRTILNSPDIVTLEEVENQSVANDIANRINTDAGIAGLYTAYSTDNSTFYSQDGTGISVGFLVKNTVNKLGFTQFGQGETFTPSTSTNPITLNDRPWLVLNAGIKRANAKDYPVTVIVNHMKALTGVNSTTSTSTRQKKELQAEDIARYIQILQASGQHVISGGDFNAFEFSDGYTDTLATYTNTSVLPSTQVVQPGISGLVNPPLTDLALTLPANQRWSYQEDGSAQILDHIVVTSDLVAAGAHMTYAHINADFPLIAYNDATTPARTSDHDIAVGYFAIPAPKLTATLAPAAGGFGSGLIGSSSTGQVFTLANTGEAALTIVSITASGDYAVSNNCGSSLATGATCTGNVVFKPTAAGARTGTLTIVTSASTLSSTLTGTGLPLPDFTVADSLGSSTTALTVVAGKSASLNLIFTPLNGVNTTLTVVCASSQSGVQPIGIICTPPAPFTVSGSAAVTQSVTFATTSRVNSSGIALLQKTGSNYASTFVLTLSGFLMLLVGRTRRFGTISGVLILLLAVCLPSIGCGSGGSNVNSFGTQPGTFTYAITANSGTTTHVETVVLTVQ